MTTANIVIGGAAGAIPPLVGWAAVTNCIGAPGARAVRAVFLWTPPHFWALALMIEIDYDKANVPMLPNVHGVRRTKIEIFVYSLILVVSSLSLTFLGRHGDLVFSCRRRCWAESSSTTHIMIFAGPTKKRARTLFKFSLLYLALMCAAMVIDGSSPSSRLNDYKYRTSTRRARRGRFGRGCCRFPEEARGPHVRPLERPAAAHARPRRLRRRARPGRALAGAARARARLLGIGAARHRVGLHALPARQHRQHPDHDEARRPYGRRPIYIACVSIFAAGQRPRDPRADVRACSCWPRAIQAVGAGGIFPVATAAIADRVPPERRGAALGLVAATWGLAAIIGPAVGGVLTHLLSWHWIFAANVPLALVVIVDGAQARADARRAACAARSTSRAS